MIKRASLILAAVQFTVTILAAIGFFKCLFTTPRDISIMKWSILTMTIGPNVDGAIYLNSKNHKAYSRQVLVKKGLY